MRPASLRVLSAIPALSASVSAFALALVVFRFEGLSAGAQWAASSLAASIAAAASLRPTLARGARGVVVLAVGTLAVSLVAQALDRTALARAMAGADAPLGLTLGAAVGLLPAGVVALVVRFVTGRAARVRVEGPLDSIEQVTLLPSLVAAAAGAFAWALGAPLSASLASLALALGIVVYVLARDRKTARWLTRVAAGQEPSLAIVTELDHVTGEFVPPVTSAPLTDAYVVTRGGPGHYRGGAAHAPIARCHVSFEKTLTPVRRRRSLTVGFALATACLVGLTHAAVTASAKDRGSARLEAPSCRDAKPFFREHVQADLGPNAGSVVLLTSDDDPEIQPNRARLVIAPSSPAPLDEAAKQRALTSALAVPCKDKLAIDVVEATYVPVSVQVKASLDGSRARADVEDELARTTRTFFSSEDRGGRDHADLGAVDRTVGWKLRYELGGVPGARDVTVLIDGKAKDRPLGPQEMPTLASLTVTTR